MHIRTSVVGLTVAALAAACSSDGGGTPDGGGDAGDGSVILGGCDATKLPTQDACVVNDVEGIFVSSSMGSASGDGSKAKPFASLNIAITTAQAQKKRVYACAETYAESAAFVDGVSVFGYFDCSKAWAVGTSHAKVQSPTSPAATAANITSPTRVEAVDLVAPDFVDKSQSSIGIIVTGSSGLTFTNATIHAGTGGKGADGADAVQLTDSGSAKNGANSWAKGVCAGTIIYCSTIIPAHIGGAAGGSNTCVGATGHDGGPGGAGGAAGEYVSAADSSGITYHWYPQTGYPTTGGQPTQATTQTAQGGAVAQPGTTGSAGANGTAGAPGAAVGTFSAAGYTASDGTAGTDGQPGQGGGGAGAYGLQFNDTDVSAQSNQGYTGWGESGAGGGAGGCPGLAATLGKGGGASVAVIAIQSPFTLDAVKIESSNGGAAGASGKPSDPLAGGGGGTHGTYTGIPGAGGYGGVAGVSGNGGGGPSIGVAYNGTEPVLGTSTIAQGTGGAGVAQRVFGIFYTIPASPNGVSKDVYSF